MASNSAAKTNLKKLKFLGFKSPKKNDGGSNDGDAVQLDEECAKVFQMDTDPGGGPFNINKFHDSPPTGAAKHYGEKDFDMQHRKKSYPHMHLPLKIGSRSMRRRTSSSSTAPAASTAPYQTSTSPPPVLPPPSDHPPPYYDSTSSPKEEGQEAATTSPLSSTPDPLSSTTPATNTPPPSIRSRGTGDSDIGLLSSSVLHEESGGNDSSSEDESECVLSDPCGYRSPDEMSPERKVQFTNEAGGDTANAASATDDTFDDEGLTDKTRRRYQSKFRKYSLPDDPIHKKRHHHHHHHVANKGDTGGGGTTGSSSTTRRVSTQPEDLPLIAADRDQLDSHRSDDARGLRRHKTSRPSNASMVHIGFKVGGELHPSIKKMYDHSPHAIFVELDELFTTNEEREWKETARWIKYEEDVEEGVDRWGKPHVASLSFHSLLNLRKCLEEGLVALDMEERDLPAIAYRVSEDLYREDLIREEDKGKLMRALLLRHRHVNEHHDRGFRFTKKHSYTSLQNLAETAEKRKISFIPDVQVKNGGQLEAHSRLMSPENHVIDMKEEVYSTSNEDVRKARNDAILKRIPAGAQSCSILVGEVDFLEQPAIAFIRLAEPVSLPSLIEVNIPVRFIFILLGPKRANLDYHEVGRSISTLMANQQFHNIAYQADNRKALLSAINEFLDDSIVLPPGDWERQALLPIEELKAKSEAIRRRKENALKSAAEAQGLPAKALLAGEDGGDEKKPPFPNPLERTRRPFGGLINDIKRRYPHYLSDVLDGFDAQCIAAAIFMYFAALSGAIAFGGLMGDKTQNSMGICETLVITCVSGLIFSLFSGQPMVIVGSTGALLLFDESLFKFCDANGIEFLTTRVFVGIWLAVIGLCVACFEGSVCVKLFTRFTEDIFSALIAFIYITESVMKLIVVYGRHPLLSNYCEFETYVVRNVSALNGTSAPMVFPDYNGTSSGLLGNSSYNNDLALDNNGSSPPEYAVTTYLEKLQTYDEFGPKNQPNTALFVNILALGTFALAYYLKLFRNSQFLGRSARRALGDFGIPIAIVLMVFIDYMVPQTYTEKLNVPEGLSPSNSAERGWFIPPMGTKQPMQIWVMFAAAIPAMLVYILLFMETHITELIIDKKERNLKKGSGFHLDIVLICLINILCGFFGMPWVCAATVRSLAHVNALTVMSRTHAPGEKPHVIQVKEQRVSALAVATLVGLSVLMSSLLRLVPMAVLFGVFLYMGVASIDGIQMFERFKLLFMPPKHHPQATYVRRVKTFKMHLFTVIQLLCLALLWVIKSTPASLAFPFFLILMVPLRASLSRFFTTVELRALDGEQPDIDDDEPDFYAEAPLPG